MRSPLSKWRGDFSLAEVISVVFGKVWDCFDDESSEGDGDLMMSQVRMMEMAFMVTLERSL